MKRATKHLRDTLIAINWSFGKGDITSVKLETGGGTVSRSMQYGRDTRQFTIIGRKVRFLGRTRLIKDQTTYTPVPRATPEQTEQNRKALNDLLVKIATK